MAAIRAVSWAARRLGSQPPASSTAPPAKQVGRRDAHPQVQQAPPRIVSLGTLQAAALRILVGGHDQAVTVAGRTELPLDLGGEQDVVCVQVLEPRAARELEQPVAGGVGAAVGDPLPADPVPKPRSTSEVASVEPSSTTTISRLGQVWAEADSMASPTQEAAS